MNPSDPSSAGAAPGQPSREADELLLLWAALGARLPADASLAERFARQRQRIAQRIAASAQASRALITTRYAPGAMARVNPGARLQTLYLAAEGALRPGEPLNVLLIELAPQAGLQLDAASAGVLREWLLVRGGVRLDEGLQRQPVTLAPLDYHIGGCGQQARAASGPIWLEADESGALLFLRESPLAPGAPAQAARTVRDAATPWKPYGPRVERRVLWREGALAALLYRAAPGASVPSHSHEHDEECLVLRGETFQDEVLLREADYQLAPAGSTHASGSTDSGSIFYIHGDLNLTLCAPAGGA